MRRSMMILFLMGCFLALGVTAQAVTVTVNGWREFDSGGFEADTPPLNPSNTLVGGWIVDEAIGLLNGTVDVLGPASTGPGASEGSNYLALAKDATLKANAMGAIAVLQNPALPGDSVRANFDLYVDSAGNTRISSEGCHVVVDFTSGLAGYFSNRQNWLAFNFPDGDVPTLVSSDGWQERQLYVTCYNGEWQNVTTGGGTTNMFVNPDTWLDVQVDLTVGSSYTVTIGGVTSDPITIEPGLATKSVVGLQFFDNCDSQSGLFYLDGLQNSPLPGPGDANGDGVVDAKDASILGAHWMLQTGATWATGDFNGDKKVDDMDAAVLAAHWTGAGSEASVPEPGTIALVLGALASWFVGWRLLPFTRKETAMRHCAVVLLAGAGLLLLVTDANALVIKNLLMGTTEFDSGGFESHTVGGDPVPLTAGNWQLYKRSGLINAKTEVAGPGSSGPGANEGNNYLKFEVDTVGANNPATKGGVIAALANQALTFDQISAEFALYVDSSASTWGGWANYPLMAFIKNTAGLYANRHTWATLTNGGPDWDPLLSSVGREEGQLILAYYDTAWHNVTTGGGTTNMFFDMDSWHDMQFALTVGSSYTITVDGVTSDPILIAAAQQNTPVAAFQIFTNDNTVKSLYYIDNVSATESAASVPEPGTLALVAGGLLSLLAWRRRR